MPVLRAMLSPYVIDPSQRASSRPMTEAEKEAPMSRVVVDQAIALGAWAPRSRAAALAPTPAAPGAAPPQPPLALSQVRLVASYRSRGWCSTARRRMPWPWHSMALAHTSYRSRGWCSTAPHAKYLHCRQRSLGSSLGGLRRKPCDSAASQSRPRWPRAAATSLAGPAPRQLPLSGLARLPRPPPRRTSASTCPRTSASTRSENIWQRPSLWRAYRSRVSGKRPILADT